MGEDTEFLCDYQFLLNGMVWCGMVEIGEHEFIKMQCLFLWISRWKRLAKYVKLEACTFNFLILSPLTNKIHNINILTHFRFGQSCIAFILFV